MQKIKTQVKILTRRGPLRVYNFNFGEKNILYYQYWIN